MIPVGFCKACQGRVSQEAKSCPHCGQPEPFQPVSDEVRLLVARGRTLEATKRVRELTGMDLKASKEFVESLEAFRRRGSS
jgi:ribosomal protein L7/L12